MEVQLLIMACFSFVDGGHTRTHQRVIKQLKYDSSLKYVNTARNNGFT